MNFGVMKQVAPAKVAGPSQAARLLDVNPTLVGALINEALHKVERAALWKFSEAEVELTVPRGEREPETQPADLAVPLTARNPSLRCDLLFHDERQGHHRSVDGAGQAGRVREYGIFGGQLRFFPTASQDETILLRYYRAWDDLVEDEDEPPFPATWHDILTDYAASRIALRLTPVAGKFLPSSAAEPFEASWRSGLEAMLQSDLVLTTFDAVANHALAESVMAGAGQDW